MVPAFHLPYLVRGLIPKKQEFFLSVLGAKSKLNERFRTEEDGRSTNYVTKLRCDRMTGKNKTETDQKKKTEKDQTSC